MSASMINLVYWDESNFGDILSPFIVHALSGKKIIYKEGNRGICHLIKQLLKKIITLKFDSIKSLLFPYEENLLGVGSIIKLGNRCSFIWGSGFMDENQPFHGGTICAVRGKFTNNKLKRMGYGECSTLGDPALLLPLIVSPSTTVEHIIGIIPHWSETDMFIQAYSKQYSIIDLRTRDIVPVVKEITSCQYILSTSLHGIIVAHAYGIPALWIKKGYIYTDGIKFKDYFSSVNIPLYDGFTNIDEILSSQDNCICLFNHHYDQKIPLIKLSEIQKELLRKAPFTLTDKYQKILYDDEKL